MRWSHTIVHMCDYVLKHISWLQWFTNFEKPWYTYNISTASHQQLLGSKQGLLRLLQVTFWLLSWLKKIDIQRKLWSHLLLQLNFICVLLWSTKCRHDTKWINSCCLYSTSLAIKWAFWTDTTSTRTNRLWPKDRQHQVSIILNFIFCEFLQKCVILYPLYSCK